MEQNLIEDNTQIFHSIVVKILFLRKREWLDILTWGEFLTKIVRKPDKDDKKKLSRVLKYLQSNRDLVLTLESYGYGTIKWWVDTLFMFHHGMKIPTGGSVNGKGRCVFRIEQI